MRYFLLLMILLVSVTMKAQNDEAYVRSLVEEFTQSPIISEVSTFL